VRASPAGAGRRVLGRETAIQRMVWTAEGWLRTVAGDALPERETTAPADLAAPSLVALHRRFDSPFCPRSSNGCVHLGPMSFA
jgi:xylan 1,4-beta-xylosidase